MRRVAALAVILLLVCHCVWGHDLRGGGTIHDFVCGSLRRQLVPKRKPNQHGAQVTSWATMEAASLQPEASETAETASGADTADTDSGDADTDAPDTDDAPCAARPNLDARTRSNAWTSGALRCWAARRSQPEPAAVPS